MSPSRLLVSARAASLRKQVNRAIFYTAIVSLLVMPAVGWAQAYPTQKQVPLPGIAIPEADREELEAGVAALSAELADLRSWAAAQDAAGKAPRRSLRALLPDIEVLHKAVDWALRYDEFMDLKHVATARRALIEARERVRWVRDPQAPFALPPWLNGAGPKVCGFRSQIDDSVQPFGIHLPEELFGSNRTPGPLLVWLAGRNDKRTELAFLEERWKGKPEFTPPRTIVLFPYGRFCNATKFAGETDVFEAIAALRSRWPVDPRRIALAGFSMGGASAWHLGAHHAGRWCAVMPGAGFAETAEYAKVFAPGKEPPPSWEQTLWAQYDATKAALNLFNVPTSAYSGGDDPQKQAAEMMTKAAAAEGVSFPHVIGPKTGHKYEPGAKAELAKWLEEQIAKGRPEMPARVRLVTHTLRYNSMEWVSLDALEEHWKRAEIDAELLGDGTIRITTRNVAAFNIAPPAGPPARVVIDGHELAGPKSATKKWSPHFRKHAGRWLIAPPLDTSVTLKRPGLQGPIDDAFMDRFIFVRPTGKARHEQVGAWAAAELARAVAQWRTVFRGEPLLKDDSAITADDIANAHLILWGDPQSNKVLARIAAELPLKWTTGQLTLGGLALEAAHHVPVMIYPNPLNPKRYVVLNSGFTFRSGATVSNSQQTPKLPDWAVVDLRTAPSAKAPGLIVDAGFFDEFWQMRK